MKEILSNHNFVRFILGILLLLLAINAFYGGWYGMSGAKDVPTEWLKGSIFQDYYFPGLLLFIFVGGSSLLASFHVFKNDKYARLFTFLCVLIVFIWLLSQIAIIGYVSWMQPAIAVLNLVILILALKLPVQKE